MSRLATIGDEDGTYAAYQYLGVGTIVKEDYQGVQVKLDYTGGSNALSGFDRFGRVKDQLWVDGSSNPADRYKYTYDAVGNRLTKDNAVAPTNTNLDEKYTYDALDRLMDTDRGYFNTSGQFTNPSDYQGWTLDGLGNFSVFNQNGTSQTRTAGAVNQITGISGDWITPLYDAAGNMISGPKSGAETTRLHFVYDAWNRQTAVYGSDGDVYFEPGNGDPLLASYEFDGQNRRIEKSVTADGGGIRQVDYFFNQQWQTLEERTTIGATTSISQTCGTGNENWSYNYAVNSPEVCK